MTYFVKEGLLYPETEVKNCPTYNVVEKDTSLTIKTTTDRKEARDLCRSLNLGAGFDGWTPEFFTYVYKDLK